MIVVLNGASSAGKSTVARALQDAWDEPALVWGIDTVVTALPKRYMGSLWSTEMYRYGYAEDGTVTSIEPGPYGDRVVRALHRAAAALAAGGINVIVDQVLLTRSWGDDLREACAGLDLLVVHIACPPDELARREVARGDRTLGQAAAQYRAVAESIGHDLTIDTTETEPRIAAERILAAISGLRTVSPSQR